MSRKALKPWPELFVVTYGVLPCLMTGCDAHQSIKEAKKLAQYTLLLQQLGSLAQHLDYIKSVAVYMLCDSAFSKPTW